MEKIVYSDPGYERITRNEIAEALAQMQAVLSAWNAMKMPPIGSPSELYDLAYAPETMYREAVLNSSKGDDTNVPAPASRPADPSAFYSVARTAKLTPFTGREYGLFSIVKGKVTLNETAADKYIFNRNIVARSEEQAQFAADVEVFTRVFNTINGKLGGALLRNPAFRGAWSQLINPLPEGYYDTLENPVHFKTEVLRDLIQKI